MVEYEAKSWQSILLRVRGSVLPGILWPTAAAAAVGLLATWLHESRQIGVPPIAHTLVGVALGLLLVFRTNASYDRYWEGRKLMGALTNRCRDLARQLAAYVEGDDEAARAARRELWRLLIALHALIRQLLRKERNLSAVEALGDDERAALEPVRTRPCVAAAWLSSRLAACAREGRLTEHRLQAMDANITAIVEAWGGAERITKTPLPFAYAHHIKTFLVLFCYTAPFAMAQAMAWLTPVTAAILAFALFGIDEIGIEIEDPFGYDPNDLPLDAMGAGIEEDTRAILGVRDR